MTTPDSPSKRAALITFPEGITVDVPAKKPKLAPQVLLLVEWLGDVCTVLLPADNLPDDFEELCAAADDNEDGQTKQAFWGVVEKQFSAWNTPARPITVRMEGLLSLEACNIVRIVAVNGFPR